MKSYEKSEAKPRRPPLLNRLISKDNLFMPLSMQQSNNGWKVVESKEEAIKTRNTDFFKGQEEVDEVNLAYQRGSVVISPQQRQMVHLLKGQGWRNQPESKE